MKIAPLQSSNLQFVYIATVNNNSFEVSSDGSSMELNGSAIKWDLVKISDGSFHVLLDGKSYRAEVLNADRQTKTFAFRINGRTYVVGLKDKFDLLLEKMGMNNGAASKVNNIKAPMPGLIIELRVKEGDHVHPGDPLLILEAMKMENIIKAPGDSIVKSVKVKRGDSVEKNQVLIEF